MINLLIVEDHADMRLFLKKALHSERFCLKEAPDGLAALMVIEGGFHPNLILTDLNMPGLAIEEFLLRLREVAPIALCKVMLISGQDALAQRSKALGTDGYIRKPFALEDLLEKVEQILKT